MSCSLPYPLLAVSGHDIPNDVVSNGMAALKQFFDLPHATKSSITQNVDGKGYMD